jgi:transcriptional regulator
MYLPPAFRQDDPAAIASLIAAHPFGLLITQGEAGPIADPLPFLFDPPRDGTPGMLRGHLARANPHAKALLDGGPRPALVVFQGPAAYVSPSWYPGKAETGKVVPTWNYAMVQAAGPVRAIDDAAWLRDLIEALTNSQEADRAAPWAVGDAPADFIDGLVRAIVGVEVTVEALYGK